MRIAGAFDVHRRQLTFDYLDTLTGEVNRGRVVPADRQHLRAWLARFARPRRRALRAGGVHRLAVCRGGAGRGRDYPAPGRARGHRCAARPQAARQTGKTDSRLLRVHLLAGDLPECWIPPAHVLETRAVVRLCKDLLDERGAWHQRIAATLFHQGMPLMARMDTAEGRSAVAGIGLSPAGRQAVEAALRQTGRLTGELDPLRRQLDMLSRRQPGCRALRATWFGVGAVTSVAIWAELGDVRRLGNSDDVIRHTGLDITVYSCDGRRSAGHLSRQGPPLLRWALYEAARCAARPAARDYADCTAVRARRGGGLATLPVARNLARGCYHTLRELGDQALQPAA